MKRFLPFMLIPIFFSCKKLIQQQEENAVIKIMTSGVWYVQTYNQNDTSIAAIFAGYTFQFTANGAVLAIKDSTTVATGTWVGNVDNETINSNFPGAASPLDKLNSLWKITDSSPTSVVANTMIGNDAEFLVLLKQ
ncbi:MAG TPA: hypothetical protein VKR53_17160 [Puia sp.]|nr:hypothetical protein [Puia sp.]